MVKQFLTVSVACLAYCVATSSCGMAEESFTSLFNGKDLSGWTGATATYDVQDGCIVSKPDGGGYLLTEKQYANFILKFDFQLTPGANNGIGLRVPKGAHAATAGMEIQVLDDTAKRYENLKPYQYHGSIYGVVPAKRGFLEPVGEWNSQEIVCDGKHVRVTLNGEVIVDADLDASSKPMTMDGKDHPGLNNTTGHIGLLGHKTVVRYRNFRIRELSP